MGYGDFQFYDIVIFGAIAVFLIFRLRKVLGRKTGLEKGHKGKTEHTNNFIKDINKEKNIPELDDNFIDLKKAYETFEEFDHKNFLDGAEAAFETIINAFNKGDKTTLKDLLTKEVYVIFKKEIDEKNNDSESQLLSINIEKIESVLIDGGKIIIKIKFISEQFKKNDEGTIIKKEDVWSFEKLIKSKTPNWLLSST